MTDKLESLAHVGGKPLELSQPSLMVETDKVGVDKVGMLPPTGAPQSAFGKATTSSPRTTVEPPGEMHPQLPWEPGPAVRLPPNPPRKAIPKLPLADVCEPNPLLRNINAPHSDNMLATSPSGDDADVVASALQGFSPSPLSRIPQRVQAAGSSCPSKRDTDPLGEVLDWLGRTDVGHKYKHDLPADLASLGLQLEDNAGIVDFTSCRRDLQRGFTSEMSVDSVDADDDDVVPVRAQIPKSWLPVQNRPPVDSYMQEQCPLMAAACSGEKSSPSTTRADTIDRQQNGEEDEEWFYRQQRTGSVGRLAIYASDEDPSLDVVLRGGNHRPFVVAAVHDAGPASRAGVKAGDRLVSINGKKDFAGLSAEVVRDQIRPPVMLVFVGFVGKLQAEVRLSSMESLCGVPLRNEVVKGFVDAPLMVCEQKVFDPGLASLFLVVDTDEPEAEKAAMADPIFELRHSEANSLLQKAVSEAIAPRSNRITRSTPMTREFSAGPFTRSHAPRGPDKPNGDHELLEDGTQGQVLQPDGQGVGAATVDPLLDKRAPGWLTRPTTPLDSRRPVTPYAALTPRLSPRGDAPLGSPRGEFRQLGLVQMASPVPRRALPCLDFENNCLEYCTV